LSKIEGRDFERMNLKEFLWKWRSEHFKRRPRTKKYWEKELRRVQRQMKMLEETRKSLH